MIYKLKCWLDRGQRLSHMKWETSLKIQTEAMSWVVCNGQHTIKKRTKWQNIIKQIINGWSTGCWS